MYVRCQTLRSLHEADREGVSDRLTLQDGKQATENSQTLLDCGHRRRLVVGTRNAKTGYICGCGISQYWLVSYGSLVHPIVRIFGRANGMGNRAGNLSAEQR